jgi:hypothetical protein
MSKNPPCVASAKQKHLRRAAPCESLHDRFARFTPDSSVRGAFAGVLREKFFTCLTVIFFALVPQVLHALALDARANVIASVTANDFTESPVSSAFLRGRRISPKTLVRICLLTRLVRAVRALARNIWRRLRCADAPSCESALIFRMLV